MSQHPSASETRQLRRTAGRAGSPQGPVPEWLREQLPSRVHLDTTGEDREVPPEIAAQQAHEQLQPSLTPPSSRPPQGDPFAIHETRRAKRRRVRERLRARRPARDLARVNSGLGRRAPSNEEYDEQSVEVMRRTLTRSSCCVDVGCHRGELIKRMIELAPEGRHFGFEPLPHLYRELTGSVGDNAQVELFQVALAETSGKATFHFVKSNPGYSGLRLRRYDRPDEQVELIEVRTERLDDLLPDDLPIALIKIDVEGAELGVLRGAEKTLKTHRPIVIFEHGLGGADYYGYGPGDVFEFLVGECDMRINTMIRWMQGEPPFCKEEFEEHWKGALNYYFLAYGLDDS